MDLTKRIIEIRENKKISKTEVAQGLNIDLSNYFRVEKKGSKLTYEQIEAISNALGVSVKEFLFAETDAIQQVDVKELEDLRKENENLKKEIHYENLLKSNDIEKMEILCWNFIREFMMSEVDDFCYYLYNEKIKIIADSVLNSNDEEIKSIIDEVKKQQKDNFKELDALLSEYSKKEDLKIYYETLTDYYERFFARFTISGDEGLGKDVLKVFEEMIKAPFNNEPLIEGLIGSITYKEIRFEEHYFGFIMKYKLIKDVRLLNIRQVIDKLLNEEEQRISHQKTKTKKSQKNLLQNSRFLVIC